ncbi:MAG: hypothetical protein AAF533_18115 [Acidobacteriota bacterium]
MNETTAITYEFWRGETRHHAVTVELELPSRRLVATTNGDEPAWTALGFRQCTNCPLSSSDVGPCPVAANLSPVLEAFKDVTSIETMRVEVRHGERCTSQEGSVKDGLASLFGLIMATSGCPVLDFLRPMTNVHQPFASPEETTFRAVSTYLMGQYFRQRAGHEPDWELSDLVELYAGLRTVNRCFAKRISAAIEEDAGSNALVQLNALADIASFSVTESWWEEFEESFSAHAQATTVPTPVS